MSRTDAHAPFLVRLSRGDLHAVPARHHTGGGCDLPPLRDWHRAWAADTHCEWQFHFTGTKACCCELCHGGVQSRTENRSDRRAVRRLLDEARTHWAAGDLDAFDDVIPSGAGP